MAISETPWMSANEYVPIKKTIEEIIEEPKAKRQDLLERRQKDNLRERFKAKFQGDYSSFFSFFGVDTTGSSGKAMICCVFHQDKTPSLSIQFRDGLFNCFGCGAKGDALDFASKIYGMTIPRDFEKLLLKLKEDFGL